MVLKTFFSFFFADYFKYVILHALPLDLFNRFLIFNRQYLANSWHPLYPLILVFVEH